MKVFSSVLSPGIDNLAIVPKRGSAPLLQKGYFIFLEEEDMDKEKKRLPRPLKRVQQTDGVPAKRPISSRDMVVIRNLITT
ncbi:hypothetical protein GGP41_010208 [Bipolaris sorokiniana]|uniref:Uncharacterized protein n=1 Tax=Cochliobolus sativus TaxID=45130 RepID=A0A8H5ZKN6_COCSA|nr:hypothetical protein GGP41_010208 [Bipolaris sorokiniana]